MANAWLSVTVVVVLCQRPKVDLTDRIADDGERILGEWVGPTNWFSSRVQPVGRLSLTTSRTSAHRPS